jgi:hypothetical protein
VDGAFAPTRGTAGRRSLSVERKVGKMKFNFKDIVASLLVAAIVVPYIGYLMRGDMPFIQDPRGMAATGLILGLAAAAFAGRVMFAPGVWHRVTLVIGVITLVVGVAAFWVATSELLLAMFMIGIVVTWALAELVHTRDMEPVSAAGRVPQHN